MELLNPFYLQDTKQGEQKAICLAVKNLWGVQWQEKLPVSKESPLRVAHGVLEPTQTHTLRNQHQGSTSKGTICVWEVGVMAENGARAK